MNGTTNYSQKVDYMPDFISSNLSFSLANNLKRSFQAGLALKAFVVPIKPNSNGPYEVVNKNYSYIRETADRESIWISRAEQSGNLANVCRLPSMLAKM